MDNDTPNDYGAWSPDAEPDVKAEQAEQVYLKASIPVIDEVLAWFDEMIATYADPLKLDAISPSSDPKQVKEALLFAQTVMQDYKTKQADFTQRFSKYIAKEDES